MTISLPKPSAADLEPFIQAYLASRPLFYAFIRPQEAYLFSAYSRYLQPPILDFGCGDGFFASLIVPPQTIAVGLDVENSRINENPPQSPYKQLLVYDGRRIPQPSGHFHTIISNCVFEHLPDLSGNLREMWRLLKPGGHLLTTVMSSTWEENLLGDRFLGTTYRQSMRRRQVHINLFSTAEWDQHYTQAGFIIKRCIGYLHLKPSRFNELGHYVALPSLVSYRLFKRWVLWPAWYRPVHLDAWIASQLVGDIQMPNPHSAAYFYILQKPL